MPALSLLFPPVTDIVKKGRRIIRHLTITCKETCHTDLFFKPPTIKQSAFDIGRSLLPELLVPLARCCPLEVCYIFYPPYGFYFIFYFQIDGGVFKARRTKGRKRTRLQGTRGPFTGRG